MTNQEKSKFIEETCKENAARIVGEILNLEYNDGTDALNIGQVPAPYYPKDNESEKVLKYASSHFFGNENYRENEDNILNHWNEAPEEAPPGTIATLVNMYHTALGYYADTASNKQWTARETITDYHPEDITRDYKNEIEEIKRQEAAALKAAEEKRKAEELAERRRKEQELMAAKKEQEATAARALKETAATVPRNPETTFNNLWKKNPVDATLYLIKKTEAGAIPYSNEHYKTISAEVKSRKEHTIDATVKNKTRNVIYDEACRGLYDHYPTLPEAVAEYRHELEKRSDKLNAEAGKYAPKELQEYKDLGLLLKTYYQLNPELKTKPIEVDYSDILKRAKERNSGLYL